MPPMPTLHHLAGLQHAQQIQIAEHRHRLFRQPLTARPAATTRGASIIAMPTPRHAATSAAKVA